MLFGLFNFGKWFFSKFRVWKHRDKNIVKLYITFYKSKMLFQIQTHLQYCVVLWRYKVQNGKVELCKSTHFCWYFALKRPFKSELLVRVINLCPDIPTCIQTLKRSVTISYWVNENVWFSLKVVNSLCPFKLE